MTTAKTPYVGARAGEPGDQARLHDAGTGRALRGWTGHHDLLALGGRCPSPWLASHHG
jgi:hypothetical protein